MSKPHVWITGASRGIGAAIAHRLSEEYTLTLSGRNEASLQQVANLLPEGSATCIQCDVADADSVAQAHAQAVKINGNVDILINNAGIGIFKDLATLSIEEFDDQIAINLRGVFLCTKVVLPSMKKAQRGLIATINSVASVKTFSGASGYGASKAGALALTRSLRAEVRSEGIKICDLLVGATETDIWNEGTREERADEMMQANDIAQLIADVCATLDHPRTHIEEIVVRPQGGDL